MIAPASFLFVKFDGDFEKTAWTICKNFGTIPVKGGRPSVQRKGTAVEISGGSVMKEQAQVSGSAGLPPETLKQQFFQVLTLSVPAILAQISSMAMQYIDAAMVGSLGAKASAAIGLVSTSTWLMGGMCISLATGFSVQVAQLVGAGREREARDVLRQALLAAVAAGVLLCAVGVSISGGLPAWLGGEADIQGDAASYFFIYSCAVPAVQMRQLSGSVLQCSGDMRTPSLLNALMCLEDVVFNSLLIFPGFTLPVVGVSVPGAGLGVTGAALGTALAEWVTAVLMTSAACLRAPVLRLTQERGRWRPTARCLRTAAGISVPMAFEYTVMCGAQIASTRIVAPLGTVSIAANSLAVTAESVCYLPGYGVAAAATTLVGQSLGAGRRDLARRFARLSVLLAMGLMTVMGVLMFLFAPAVFALLTPDQTVRTMGVQVLRIEAFAEPLYAASIACAGAMRGAGDTLVPSILNLVSMWGVRITAAALLSPRLGLAGVWLAMCGELCVRGVLFLIRLFRERWLDRPLSV